MGFMGLLLWCLQGKNDEVVRNDKTEKATGSFIQMFYFTIMGIWGYEVLKDSYYLPESLGGSGDMDLTTKDYPIHEWPSGLKFYYLASMGYHLYAMVE